jgi:hypothetical protein
VVLAFWRHAEARYGAGGKELAQYRYSLRPLKELYGATPAARISPKCLRAVRQRMIDLGWCRTLINRRVARVKTLFGWAVAEELVPPAVAHGLREVRGLRPGESAAREREPADSGPRRPARHTGGPALMNRRPSQRRRLQRLEAATRPPEPPPPPPTTPGPDEAGELAAELAMAFRRMVEHYRKEYQLPLQEAAERAAAPSTEHDAEVMHGPPDRASCYGLERVGEADPEGVLRR